MRCQLCPKPARRHKGSYFCGSCELWLYHNEERPVKALKERVKTLRRRIKVLEVGRKTFVDTVRKSLPKGV